MLLPNVDFGELFRVKKPMAREKENVEKLSFLKTKII